MLNAVSGNFVVNVVLDQEVFSKMFLSRTQSQSRPIRVISRCRQLFKAKKKSYLHSSKDRQLVNIEEHLAAMEPDIVLRN